MLHRTSSGSNVAARARKSAGSNGDRPSQTVRHSTFPTSKSPVDNLTEAQLAEFREAFDTFDEDAGGTIDKNELRKLLNYAGQAPSEDELQNMINIIDAEGTGDINFPEFVTLMAHKMASDVSEETLKGAFGVFTADGNDCISGTEFHRVLENLGETGISVEDITEVLSGKHARLLGDTDGDGTISYAEFRQMIIQEKSTGVKGRAAYIQAVEKEGQHGELGLGNGTQSRHPSRV